MTPRARRAAAILLGWIAATGSAGAQGDDVDDVDDLDDPAAALIDAPADYDVGNADWNGLSAFARLAAGAGYRFEARAGLDWSDVTAADTLVLLYPVTPLDATDIAAFVRGGGRLVLADDFGGAARALARLGVAIDRAESVAAPRYYADLPFAPIAAPLDPTHPLAAGVDELVTNHPAVIVQARGDGEIFGFEPGRAVVVAGTLGYGRYVVLSDPSVLINAMLRHPGNFRFALNLLRYFDPDRSGRVVVLAGEFSVRGRPPTLVDDGSLRGAVDARLRDVNNALEELNDWTLHPGAVRAIAVGVALAVALIAAAALPSRRRIALDGAWLRAQPADSAIDASDPHAIAARADAGAADAWLAPAALIRDTVEWALRRALDLPHPLGLRDGELLAAVEAACGSAARDRLAGVLPALRTVPPASAPLVRARKSPQRGAVDDFDARAAALIEALESASRDRR